MRRIWRLTVAMMAVCVGACETSVEPGEGIVRPDVRPYVTPDVYAQLDGNGHFTLPEPSSPGGHPMLSRREAQELGTAFIKSFLANPKLMTLPGSGDPRAEMEQAHGHSIDWSKVLIADEPHFAATYVEALPDSFPNHVHNHFGPKYLLSLVVDGHQVAALSIASYATDVTVSSDGYVQFPTHHGNEFRTSAAPHSFEFGLPMSPEAAVAFLGTQVGVRIAELPQLQIAEIPWTSFAARWRLVLEREVDFVRGLDGSLWTSRVVYVGVMPSLAEATPEDRQYVRRLFVPAVEQPKTERVRFNWPQSEVLVDIEWPVIETGAPLVHEVTPVRR